MANSKYVAGRRMKVGGKVFLPHAPVPASALAGTPSRNLRAMIDTGALIIRDSVEVAPALKDEETTPRAGLRPRGRPPTKGATAQ